MNSIGEKPPRQGGAPSASDMVPLRADALNVVLSYIALLQPPVAFQLLEYLHSAASHVPDQPDAYLVAADDLRELLGIDRLMGYDER